MPVRIIFFGTPSPALVSLTALSKSDNQVLAVVTAPDRPRGRGMKTEHSPVKNVALEAGIEVLQPPTLRSSDIFEELRKNSADLFVVVAYGLILPEKVLNIPRLGSMNVHFSLLPRLRGAAPVQWALIEGYSETGVTIMQMDSGVDTGPILKQRSEPIQETDDTGTLEARLALLGADLLVETINDVAAGKVTPRPQDESLATHAPKLTQEDARLDWSLPAPHIHNRVRAFRPRPGAWTMLGSRRIKIWQLAIADGGSKKTTSGIIRVSGDKLLVGTGTTEVELIEVQPEGKKRISAAEFVRGYRPQTTDRFS